MEYQRDYKANRTVGKTSNREVTEEDADKTDSVSALNETITKELERFEHMTTESQLSVESGVNEKSVNPVTLTINDPFFPTDQVIIATRSSNEFWQTIAVGMANLKSVWNQPVKDLATNHEARVHLLQQQGEIAEMVNMINAKKKVVVEPKDIQEVTEYDKGIYVRAANGSEELIKKLGRELDGNIKNCDPHAISKFYDSVITHIKFPNEVDAKGAPQNLTDMSLIKNNRAKRWKVIEYSLKEAAKAAGEVVKKNNTTREKHEHGRGEVM